MELTLKQYKSSGVLVNKYQPLHNLLTKDTEGHKHISDFTTKNLGYEPSTAVDISCQPSYDGTVNLIINDDKNTPRLINSKFTKIEGNQYKVITRNQKNQTNIYDDEVLDNNTSLFLTTTTFPKIHLSDVRYNGQLKGGDYVFYIKYCDEDFNETDIVAESGQVSVFHGITTNPKTISGSLYNERTNKSIVLRINNLDTAFKKLQLYYSRATSDTEGFLLHEYGKFDEPYDINNDTIDIILTGFEKTTELTREDLNIQYNVVNSAKTQAQVQNMLFFGNIERSLPNSKDLATISCYIKAELKQRDYSIGYVTKDYTTSKDDSYDQLEYYNPKNTYYYLGYWPEEFYRFGVVYIMKDGSLSPVYNLRGCNFATRTVNYRDVVYNKEVLVEGVRYEVHKVYDERDNVTVEVCYIDGEPVLLEQVGTWYKYLTSDNSQCFTKHKLPKELSNSELAGEHGCLYADVDKKRLNYLENNWINDTLDNSYGVFKNRQADVIAQGAVKPLYYNFTLSEDIIKELRARDVVGYFFVRQKRIPVTLGQGLSCGIVKGIGAPAIYDGSNYILESFVDKGTSKLTHTFFNHKRTFEGQDLSSSALISVDTALTPSLQSTYNGEEFRLDKVGVITLQSKERHYFENSYTPISNQSLTTRAIFVNEDIPAKVVDDYLFSSRLGCAESVTDFAMTGPTSKDGVFRGIYTPYIGVTETLEPNVLYNIKHANYDELHDKEYMQIRGANADAFYAVSDRYSLDETPSIDVYRGDCFTNTVTVRILRNFADPDLPLMDTILEEDCWKLHYNGINNVGTEEGQTDFTKINRGDVNAVALGMWLTYKCLSSYNIGLRAIDESNSDEIARMGSPRAFYPVRGMSVKSSAKVPESHTLNSGYSQTVGIRDNFSWTELPYEKDVFDNRVMFSNIAATDEFKNGYRVFQGLSYKDIDRQYGAIVKLYPWGRDLLCIFEHGIGILPVNQKALMSTTTDQSIHLYGLGVLSSDVSVISQDFGSIWKDSIIRTPQGVYGVDTYARKIWKVNIASSQLEIISDFKVQEFLNKNIKLSESDQFAYLGLKNVSSHFNNNKGDVMFTFYNKTKGCSWNLCYNERQGKWITRYSWIPLLSENINNQYYSFDQKRAEIYAVIYNNKSSEYGLHTDNQQLTFYQSDGFMSNHEINVSLAGYDTVDQIRLKVTGMETSFLDNNHVEHTISIDEYPHQEIDEETGEVIDYQGFDWLLPVNNSVSRTSTISLIGPRLNAWMREISTYDDLPVYLFVDVEATLFIGEALVSTKIKDRLGFLIEPRIDGPMILQQDDLLRNAFYVHGQAGVFDEIDYEDASYDNQILPCRWYNKQEPFEFEFVVNGDEVGMHKIFNDLQIISNNVEPSEFEYEIVGDVYDFNKRGIFRAKAFGEDEYANLKFKQYDASTQYKVSQDFRNADVTWNTTTNEYSIRLKQPVLNIKSGGRIAGNIHYKEGVWYTTIDPLKFRKKYLLDTQELKIGDWQSTRLRDKYVKVRVKYTGDNLVIITALRSLYTLSFA